ncbi:ISKra4 family transposase [Actinoallomurus sp. CA-150999]|uniref:ISKra4 family transposase n=1 Tax=Actinoallomurus sp. CA-150999 TaxID=3239887 RepID=UPI003D90EE73
MEPYADAVTDDEFATSRNLFDRLIADLAAPITGELTHAELEELCQERGREIMRQLLQDHLDLRALGEEARLAAGRPAGRLEKGHHRLLATVVGTVTVRRCAIRAPGRHNHYPADEGLALPAGRHSHGLAKLAVMEAVRGSFDAAHAAITARCGSVIGKRQIEDLVVSSATDIDGFYTARTPVPRTAEELLVLSVDGKGVVMRPEALRPDTRKAAARHRHRFRTRLASGEKPYRKRMATLVVVHDAVPAPRRSHDVISLTGRSGHRPVRAGPTATGKWIYGSVIEPAQQVIACAFDQAGARDAAHARPWVVLVDGDPHQIRLLQAEATRRGATIHIVCDLIHVLEYCWRAARNLHTADDPAAEQRVAAWALGLLAGNTDQVIDDMTTQAAALPADRREGLQAAIGYLTRHREFLHYRHALEQGWPIATGVVEGTARHLIGDRLEITGARWGLAGAEAILKLRAVISNGDLDAYWAYHLDREQRRLHQARHQDKYTFTA